MEKAISKTFEVLCNADKGTLEVKDINTETIQIKGSYQKRSFDLRITQRTPSFFRRAFSNDSIESQCTLYLNINGVPAYGGAAVSYKELEVYLIPVMKMFKHQFSDTELRKEAFDFLMES